MTLPQLRVISNHLGLSPSHLLVETDKILDRLRTPVVEINDEKGILPTAILVGLGILAAIFAASR